MGKNEWKSLLKGNTDKKPIHPIALLFAFIFGAVIAFAASWRLRTSKDKKGSGTSDEEGNSDSTERELKELIQELRSENERRKRADREEHRKKNESGRENAPAGAQTQQVKPYRPRRRVSWKKIFGRTVAVAAAAALVVTGLYMVPYDRAPVPTVQARETFGGIKQVVEEHDEKDPFIILDIVPGIAQAEVNGKTYEFSLGTIGYLAPGQSPIQKDLTSIFKGNDEEKVNTDFYEYADRMTLTNSVIGTGGVGSSYGGITYQEAYAGTGEDLRASLWSQIFDSVEVEHDGNGILTDAVSYPTGRLYAHVQKRPDVSEGTDIGSLPARQGFDYNLTWQPEGSTLFSMSAMAVAPTEGIYTFAEGQGDYHVVFGEPAMAASGYRAEVVKSVSGGIDDVKSAFAEYVDATGLYYVEDGQYKYLGCTLGEFKGIPRPEPKPEEPEKPVKPENPTNPENPEQPTNPENPVDPTDPEQPTNPEQPTDPTNPEQPTNPTEQPQPEQPSDPEPAPEAEPTSVPEGEQSQPVASAFRTQSVLKRAGALDGWYLCVGTEPAAEPTAVPETTPAPAEPVTSTEPTEPATPAEPTEPVTPVEPTEPVAPVEPTEPAIPVEPTEPVIPVEPTEPVTPAEPIQPEMPEDGTYCILKFTYVETEEEQLLYQIKDVSAVSTEEGIAHPFDSYILEESLFQNKLKAVETDPEAFEEEPALAGQFEYVGDGKGMYKITRSRVAENVARMSGTVSQDVETPDSGLEETGAEGGQDAEVQSVSARAAESTAIYYIEVQNAPVYIRCTGGKDFLRRYVFDSLNDDDFAIQVNTVLAGDVKQKDVMDADLVYLEDGTGLYLNQDAQRRYIPKKEGSEETDISTVTLMDISNSAITCLLEAAVLSLKPVIVDYGATVSEENTVGANYKESNYQLLAKAFLKKDLQAFYNDMAKDGKLADNILMNLADGKELKEHPDKDDNEYNYVNRNVYIVNGTPLVGEDFADAFEEVEAKAGFGEVLAAIRAENMVQSGDDKLSEKVSKAMAIQYIINYSLGLVGEYKDLTILELQPTANKKSDLWQEPNGKGGVVLFWQRQEEDQDGTAGQQILRSSKEIKINKVVSSVATFNTNYEDINEKYNMIFIGLDGQRFYHERDKDGKMVSVFNDDDLIGKVYHKGDKVLPDSDVRYDENDITEQKKNALLGYLQAGYPIVVENECFIGKSAQEAGVDDINKDLIGSDTQMYDFLRKAIRMVGADNDDGESGVGIYTIEDVHSSAMFTLQLNAQRPKITLRGTDESSEGESGEDSEEKSEEEQTASDMIEAEPVPEKPGILRGTIEYRITSDRAGDNKAYQGSLNKHLYLDLNYDGVYAPEEEFTGYQVEESDGTGKISVDFNEINFGIVPWKLEVRDADYEFRRASVQGCFTISGGEKAKIRVLQILDDPEKPENQDANFQKQFEDVSNSTLASYLGGAESKMNMSWEIETIAPTAPDDKDSLEKRLEDPNYLSQWDVVVLGFGGSKNPGGTVMNAVNDFIDAGGSVLISSAGASEDEGRLGLSAAALGQKDAQKTYGKLGWERGSKFRYEGIEREMLDKKAGLLVDRVNDGTIARWPYGIDTRVQLSNVTELVAPDYLLDIGTVRKEGVDTGKAYTTAWFALSDNGNADEGYGGYSISPRDGRNNYYVYSKGNVVYVGQSTYPYYYKQGEAAPSEGDGIYECQIFVNALAAAYNAGVHRADVSIVAGFNGKTKVESVTVPFDAAFKDSKTDGNKGGILGETVDVYFRFTDNNIAFDKVTERSFYYKNAGAPKDAVLLQPDGSINTDNSYTEFPSPTPIWAVENNRLVEVTGELVPGKVYRIKAPLTALQTGDDATSQICVLIKSRYTRARQLVETYSMDSVSLNRAQMFLLE